MTFEPRPPEPWTAAEDARSGHRSRVQRGAGDAALVPDLEIVDVPRESSFKIWSHGYPFRTVRWHFHPEYEIHLVTETSGRSFIGDYIGTFAPGNLVMTGPNLPHNWISDVAKGEVVAQRGIVIQFTSEFIAGCLAVMPELRTLEAMLRSAASGIEFAEGTGKAARPLFGAMLASTGAERIGQFFRLLALLQAAEFRQLASDGFRPRPEVYASDPLNHVIDHVARNLCEKLTQTELAQLSGFTPTAFSRAFRQHTGLTFVRYVNRLRIDRACELLITSDDSVADICFQVGFNNLSNFNRHFLARKGLSPSSFRREYRSNASTRFTAEPPPTSVRTHAFATAASANAATARPVYRPAHRRHRTTRPEHTKWKRQQWP